MLNIKVNDRIEKAVVIVRQISKRVGQNGKEYYNLQISHGIKNYDAKIWNNNEEIARAIKPGCFAYITGIVKDFKGTLQIHIENIEKIENPDEDIIKNVTPSSELSNLNISKDINSIIETVKTEGLKTLLIMIFETDNIKNSFYQKAAGAEIHHAYVGGLAQHTLEVAKMVINYCSIYSFINYDIAVTAALLHDIGKTVELSNFPENKYTNKGRLLGHITLGVQIIDSFISKIENFPPDLKIDLEHCILSHHGTLEMGSPILPMTVEAAALHNADAASAELNGFYLAIQRDNSTNVFTEYSNTYKRYIKK